MGKGDKRTFRGKVKKASYGISRKKTVKKKYVAGTKAPATTTTTKKK